MKTGRPKSKTTLKIEAIAAKTKLSPKYIRQLNRDQKMPLEPLSAAISWLETRGTHGTEDGDNSVADLRRERIRLVRIQSEAAQLRLDIERNLMLTREEVKMQHSVGGYAVRSMLLALELGLPPLVIGKTISQTQEIIRHQLRLVMTAFQDAQNDFWRDRPTEKPE